MTKQPLVSIYIPTKNRVALLERAIKSVLAQSVQDIEIIVVSDGSTDGTCDYVRSIAGAGAIPIRLIHNEASVGACAARNQAIEIAQGKFITGLDDDDFFMPYRLQKFLEAWEQLEREGVVFSCLFDSRIVDAGTSMHIANMWPEVSAEQILRSNEVGNQVFTTRQRMVEVGMFDPLMPAWQDWELWVRLLHRFGVARNIQAKSYYMDISHEFERITTKSPDKILKTARMFYAKHCTKRQLTGILLSLDSYPQVRLTLRDLAALAGDKQLRMVLRKIRDRKYSLSLASSI